MNEYTDFTIQSPDKIFFKDLTETFKYRTDILRGKVIKGIIDLKSIVEAEKEVIDEVITNQWHKEAISHRFFNRKELKSLGDNVSGVYLIYDKRDVLQYIGMSHNLKTRLNSHFTRFDIDSIIAYEIDSPIVALVEMYLISQLFPYENIEGKVLYSNLSLNHIDDVCKPILFYKNTPITLQPIRTHL